VVSSRDTIPEVKMAEFNFNMNDPAVLAKKSMPLPTLEANWPKFSVENFTGSPGRAGTPEAQAATVWIFIAHTLGVFQKYLPTPISKWAATRMLSALPRAGRQLNAFYDRRSLRFYYENHPITKKIVFLCESSDVVCHEFGHACLDAIRPDLWSNPAIEVSAFHESFADCIAILSTLNHPEMIDFVLSETDGNMRLTNSVSKIAEEMGSCLSALYPNAGRPSDFLRNAINPFRYANPSDLPNNGIESRLTKEGHSFSRVFTGAFYDAIAAVYESLLASGMPAKQALSEATDNCGKALMSGVLIAKLSPRFYESVARSIIASVIKLNLKGFKEITGAFLGRAILDSSIIPLSISEDNDMGSINTSINHNPPLVIKLSDYVAGDNPLYNVEVEIPSEQKFCISVENSEQTDEAIKASKEGLDHLVATGKVCYHVTESKEEEFRVENGKLVRHHVSCW
jgi:hypothetical protein